MRPAGGTAADHENDLDAVVAPAITQDTLPDHPRSAEEGYLPDSSLSLRKFFLRPGRESVGVAKYDRRKRVSDFSTYTASTPAYTASDLSRLFRAVMRQRRQR